MHAYFIIRHCCVILLPIVRSGNKKKMAAKAEHFCLSQIIFFFSYMYTIGIRIIHLRKLQNMTLTVSFLSMNVVKEACLQVVIRFVDYI